MLGWMDRGGSKKIMLTRESNINREIIIYISLKSACVLSTGKKVTLLRVFSLWFQNSSFMQTKVIFFFKQISLFLR